MSNTSQETIQTTVDHKKRAGKARTVVVGAAAATAALLAACSPGGGTDAAPRETTTTTAEATTTTKAGPTPAEVKAYSDAVEKNKFNERLQEAKVELATEIVEAYENNSGNFKNYFYEFDQSDVFEPGYGAVNVLINSETDGPGTAEYGLIATMKRNADGSFDPSTVDSVHVFKQVNRSGIDGPGQDRVPVEAVIFNYNTADLQVGGETQRLSDYDVVAGGNQIDTLNQRTEVAHNIINSALAGEPVNL